MTNSNKKKVLLWPGQGRLGNRLFQYSAILDILQDDDLVFLCKSSFTRLVDCDYRFKKIPIPNSLSKYFEILFQNFFLLLFKVKLIGSIAENPDIYSRNSGYNKIIIVNGLLSNIYLVNGFFQYSEYQDSSINIFTTLVNKAKFLLSQVPAEGEKVAVHLRLGDYKSWEVNGVKGADLPKSFFIKSIEQISKNVKNPVFIVFSDDANIPSDYLGVDFHFCNSGDELIDFMCMSLCNHAIISSSSFSWWAAHIFCSDNKIIYAPKYWLGFKSAVWFPPYIKSHKITYLDISNQYVDLIRNEVKTE